MKYKVSELTDIYLDAAVAKAQWLDYKIADGASCCLVRDPLTGNMSLPYRPSVLWELGGPIIERKCIDLWYNPDGDTEVTNWHASCRRDQYEFDEDGPTPLTAAMRAYVASKFEAEVEL